MAALAALAAAAGPARAQTTPQTQTPRLIVAIAVDQFSADLFAEYRGVFTGGLKRLAGGAVFPAAYQGHAATETCPGHATMLTGARPARSGIIANDWIDRDAARDDKRIYCAEDARVPGSSSSRYTVSARNLKVPTLGDRMKAANPASRVVAIAGKDRAAVMMGGHAPDQIWFWGGARFDTLADRAGPPPAAVAAANARAAALVARPGKAVLPPQCAGRSMAVTVGDGSVGTIADRKAEDFRGFRTAVEFDAITAELAVALLDEMKLGRGAAPDLLTISLSATDYVGHSFGTAGAEMCAQMLALDGAIGRILTALDRAGMPYAVALTADHGGHDLPERNRLRGFADAERIDPALSARALSDALMREFNLATPPLTGEGEFYVARDVPDALRPRLIAATLARLTAHPQVAAAYTADALRRMPAPRGPVDEWSLAERYRAGFDPERSGDIIVALRPHVMPIAVPGPGHVATHGSPWAYDRRVPMLFWWPGMTGFEQPLAVETVDMLPTLAALIGLLVPAADMDGRCLDLDAGPETRCPAP